MEGKLATIWRDEKEARLGRSSDMETVRREKIHVRRVGKSGNEDDLHREICSWKMRVFASWDALVSGCFFNQTN